MALIAAVLLAHIAVIYSIMLSAPTVDMARPIAWIGHLSIIHPKRLPLMLPTPVAALSAPAAPFIPVPEIRVRHPPSMFHTRVARITELTGYTQIPGTGTHYGAGRLTEKPHAAVFPRRPARISSILRG